MLMSYLQQGQFEHTNLEWELYIWTGNTTMLQDDSFALRDSIFDLQYKHSSADIIV